MHITLIHNEQIIIMYQKQKATFKKMVKEKDLVITGKIQEETMEIIKWITIIINQDYESIKK